MRRLDGLHLGFLLLLVLSFSSFLLRVESSTTAPTTSSLSSSPLSLNPLLLHIKSTESIQLDEESTTRSSERNSTSTTTTTAAVRDDAPVTTSTTTNTTSPSTTTDDFDPLNDIGVSHVSKMSYWSTYIFINFIGSIMCTLLIYTLIWKIPNKISSDYLITGLCTACCAFSYQCTIQCLMNVILSKFSYGETACYLEAFMHMSSMNSMWLFLTAMAADQYRTIVHGVQLTNKQALGVCVGIWMWSLIGIGLFGMTLPIFMAPSGMFCFFKFDSLVMYGFFFPSFTIATVAMIYYYSSIWLLNRRLLNEIRSSLNTTHAERLKIDEIRLATKLLLFIGAFLFSWLLVVIAVILLISTGNMFGLDGVGGVLGSMHSILVPLVYGWINPRVKYIMKEMVPGLDRLTCCNSKDVNTPTGERGSTFTHTQTNTTGNIAPTKRSQLLVNPQQQQEGGVSIVISEHGDSIELQQHNNNQNPLSPKTAERTILNDHHHPTSPSAPNLQHGEVEMMSRTDSTDDENHDSVDSLLGIPSPTGPLSTSASSASLNLSSLPPYSHSKSNSLLLHAATMSASTTPSLRSMNYAYMDVDQHSPSTPATPLSPPTPAERMARKYVRSLVNVSAASSSSPHHQNQSSAASSSSASTPITPVQRYAFLSSTTSSTGRAKSQSVSSMRVPNSLIMAVREEQHDHLISSIEDEQTVRHGGSVVIHLPLDPSSSSSSSSSYLAPFSLLAPPLPSFPHPHVPPSILEEEKEEEMSNTTNHSTPHSTPRNQ